ncbi:hypothetical protein MUCCIDRAFT_165733 [Mucor lusitanicus CBS 277.49]|uniref:Kinetochore protein SPC25 n=1 Tax=Mucor lusitanicus CBS 277.49 TaxID=747725 RepID=A0A168IFR7_MUCCL|nr:hypothetical protein MUCCIDRAFT_165733 [Mucor lusitanicus CBS 277.49]
MRRNVVQEQQDLDAIQQALAPRELERTEKIQERHRQFEFLVEKKNQLHNRIRQKRQEQSKVIKAETDNALLTELELDTFRRALQLEIVNTYVLPKVLKELDVLNQDRELFDFIKKLRQIFRQSANA